jgi:circadian clock protein KaiB
MAVQSAALPLTREPALSLRLYIAGRGPNSVRAIANLRAILQKYPVTQHRLEIIDVMEQPERSLKDGVLVTPMLLKLSPEPKMKVVGDLSETANVLLALGIEDTPL